MPLPSTRCATLPCLAAAIAIVLLPPCVAMCDTAGGAAAGDVALPQAAIRAPVLSVAELQRALGKLSSGSTCTLELTGAPSRAGRYLGSMGGSDTTRYAVQYERWRAVAGAASAPDLGSTLRLAARDGGTSGGTFRGFARGLITLERDASETWTVVHTTRLESIEQSEGRAWRADSVLDAWRGAPTVQAVVLEISTDTLLVPFASITGVRDQDGHPLGGVAAAAGVGVGVWLAILAIGAIAAALTAAAKKGVETAASAGSKITNLRQQAPR